MHSDRPVPDAARARLRAKLATFAVLRTDRELEVELHRLHKDKTYWILAGCFQVRRLAPEIGRLDPEAGFYEVEGRCKRCSKISGLAFECSPGISG